MFIQQNIYKMNRDKKFLLKLIFDRMLLVLSVVYLIFVLPIINIIILNKSFYPLFILLLFFLFTPLYVIQNIIILNRNYCIFGRYTRLKLPKSKLLECYYSTSVFDLPQISISFFESYIIIKYNFILRIYIPLKEIIELQKTENNTYFLIHNSPELNRKKYRINEALYIKLNDKIDTTPGKA
jgi:hypothetical protein